MRIKIAFIVLVFFLGIGFASTAFLKEKTGNLPIVAIAYYGPHASLEAAVEGIKAELAQQGFVDKKTVRFEIANVGFDPALIPQMITMLHNKHPKVLITLNTPVAQFAKGAIKDIPVVYSVITDPVEAKLIQQQDQADGNMTGSSDRQDLNILLQFAKQIIPQAHRVGLLYATGESNDLALVKFMQQAARKSNMEVIAVPVAETRDIPVAMQNFKNKVDFIYVGASGPIQPALPVIAAESQKMHIPIFNVNEDAVRVGMALASFGVDYYQVGVQTGRLASEILNGVSLETLKPTYPSVTDHRGFISKKQAKIFGFSVPNLNRTEMVE